MKRCDGRCHDITTCVKGSKPEGGGQGEKEDEEVEEQVKSKQRRPFFCRPALTA